MLHLWLYFGDVYLLERLMYSQRKVLVPGRVQVSRSAVTMLCLSACQWLCVFCMCASLWPCCITWSHLVTNSAYKSALQASLFAVRILLINAQHSMLSTQHYSVLNKFAESFKVWVVAFQLLALLIVSNLWNHLSSNQPAERKIQFDTLTL